MYKVPHFKFIKSFEEEFKAVNRGRPLKGFWEENHVEKGKGEVILSVL